MEGDIGTNNETANEELLSILRSYDIDPEEVDKLLINHPDREFMIDGRTVEQIAGVGLESVDRCTGYEFEGLARLPGSFSSEFPALRTYIEYCKEVKLKNYCREHVDEVGENFLKHVDEDDKQLVRSFLEYVNQEQPSDHNSRYEATKRAYFKLFHSKYPNSDVFGDDEVAFREEVRGALNPFYEYSFFSYELGHPELKGDPLLAQWGRVLDLFWNFREGAEGEGGREG